MATKTPNLGLDNGKVLTIVAGVPAWVTPAP